MTYGTLSLKFIMLANGSAIVSILTFIGNHTRQAPHLRYSIYYFVAGLAVGGAAHLTAYLTQLKLFNEYVIGTKWYKDHRLWLWLTVALSFTGLILFTTGSVTAANTLTS